MKSNSAVRVPHGFTGVGFVWYGVPSPIMIIDKSTLLSSDTPGRFPKRPDRF